MYEAFILIILVIYKKLLTWMDGDLLPAHSHRGKFSPTVGKSNSDLVQENMFIYDIHEKLTPLGKKQPFVLF